LAEEIGYPVVLKACSSQLLHKTESGLVELNIRDAGQVGAAYDRLTTAASQPLEGVLVCEMVPGQRELVMGLSRQPGFGPCVMLGLGGIFAELLQDAAFRAPPLDRVEAADMCAELRAAAVLGPFRGQAEADAETLHGALIGLGRLGLERPEAAEVDINPLIIRPDGRVVAVDALVVLRGDGNA
jgi:succinyl-CoA synthetase beta subunit